MAVVEPVGRRAGLSSVESSLEGSTRDATRDATRGLRRARTGSPPAP